MAVRRVVPAILTDDTSALERMVRQAESFTSWAQLDIMDGLFVPSQSVKSDDIAATLPAFEFDVHLMVRNPANFIEGFALAGARRLTLHYEVTANPIDKAAYIKALGMEVGLALNPETPASAITGPLAEKLDAVLLLSVHPGYYGRPFIPEVLDKARELREKYAALRLGMDGGIKAENIAAVARDGVDEICVGSAVFAAENPAEAYYKLVALAEEGWQEYCKKKVVRSISE